MKASFLLLSAALCLVLGTACAPKRVPAAQPPPPPPAPKQNLVVLLPDADGKVGRIVVTNQAGSQELSQPYTAVRVERSDVAPDKPIVLEQAQVDRMFGSVLATLPSAEQSFVLYFELATDELTPESKKLLTEVLRAIKERSSTDVSLTGHTDTTGDSKSNYRLGLQRAERVAGILRSMGVNPGLLTVASHGEADLLVKTADGVAEARNRRVEVIVR